MTCHVRGCSNPSGYGTDVDRPAAHPSPGSEELAPPAVYDEMGLFRDNCDEAGIPWEGPPTVARVGVTLPPPPHARSVSGLRWGDPARDVDVVFVHGGAQNAHTWDTVCLALGRDLTALCVDLPGHGRSSWRDDQHYTPQAMADDVAVAVDRYAPRAKLVVGMSMGGMTVIALGARHPHLVRALMVVDVTPGVTREKAKAILDFVNGPQSFDSFEGLLARTAEHNPTRSLSSLRRGILHNASRQPDGSWQWRYDRRTRHGDETADPATRLTWDDLAAVPARATLVRGGVSPVVTDDDVAEWRRRRPSDDVVVVDGAGTPSRATGRWSWPSWCAPGSPEPGSAEGSAVAVEHAGAERGDEVEPVGAVAVAVGGHPEEDLHGLVQVAGGELRGLRIVQVEQGAGPLPGPAGGQRLGVVACEQGLVDLGHDRRPAERHERRGAEVTELLVHGSQCLPGPAHRRWIEAGPHAREGPPEQRVDPRALAGVVDRDVVTFVRAQMIPGRGQCGVEIDVAAVPQLRERPPPEADERQLAVGVLGTRRRAVE